MTTQHPTKNQLQQVVSMLWRRRLLILATGILGASIAGLVGLIIPTRYTAKAQIVIDPQQITSVSVNMGRALPVNELAIETQVAMLSSRNHLRHVRDSLADEPELREVAFWGQRDGSFGSAVAAETDAEEAEGGLPTIEELEKGLTSYQERQSRVVAVTFTWTDPVQAAVIANQLARLHVATLADLKRAERGSASFEQELSHLERQLSLVTSELASREAQLESLRLLRKQAESRDDLIAVLNSAFLRDLRRKELSLAAAQGNAAAGPAQGQANGPEALLEVRQQIDKEINRMIAELENERQITNVHVLSLKQRQGMIEGARKQAREQDAAHVPARHQLKPDEDPFISLLERQKHEMREQPEVSPGVQILTAAESPRQPSSPNPLLFVMPAFVAFTIGGALLATVLEGLDRRLRSARDVEEALGIDCLGLVPRLRNAWSLDKLHKFIAATPYAPYTEAIRAVTTSALQLSGAPPRPKVLVVTSAVEGEGAAALSMSLASFAACLDRRAILLDVSLGRPPVINTEQAHESGEERAKEHQGSSWKDVIVRLPDTTIDYLALQETSDDPAALVSGDEFSELVGDLRGSYDCIVIHCDPILQSTSSRLLAPLADTVLLAVRWGRSRRELVQNALLMLEAATTRTRQPSVPAMAAVVTDVDLRKHAAYRHGDVAEVLSRGGRR